MSLRLRLRPGYALTVVGTLGVALAVSGVVTAAADHALLRPLPLDAPERLVLAWEAGPGANRRLASYPTFLDWQRDATAFDGLGYARGRGTQLRTPDGPERLTAAYVTPGYLRVLGAHPRLGRAFTADEERAGRGDAVVISDGVWRRAFGGDAGVVGRTITLDDATVTVVGVLPPGAGYPLWADLWRPIAAIADVDPALATRHHHSDSRVIGRLRAGTSADAAARQLATIERRLAAAYPEQGAEWTRADATPLGREVVGDAAPALRALAGAAALVLLVASLNVATLLLLRAMARERELAIRAALGAGRARLLRLVAAESAWLGVGATTVGLALTALGLRWLRTAAPDALPRAAELALDARSALIVIALGTLATAVAAAGPLFRAARGEPRAGRSARSSAVEALRAGWQATSGGRGARRARGALVVAQLALAVALLSGAGLLLDSFRRLRAVDLGFDPAGVTVFWVTPPNGRYDAPEQAAALYDRLLDAARGVPGVEAAAVANHVPLSGGYIPTNVVVPGRAPASDGEDQALYKTVSEDYLRVLKTPLLRGRWFDASDMRGGSGVVINEAMARRYWPNADPIGKPVTIFRSSQARAGFGDAEPSVVIGVVAGERHLAVADEPVSEVYVPYTREVWPQISLAVRSRLPAARLEPALRRAVLGVEPALPVRGTGLRAGFRLLGGFVDASLTDRRGAATLLAAFAAAAIGLSALGLYGAVAFGVAQRSREFGVRLAIGAAPRDVRGLVVREGARLAAAGAVLGVGAAYGVGRLVAALLFQTAPLAPLVVGGAVAILAGVALAASWLPARRAAHTDAVRTLRDDT